VSFHPSPGACALWMERWGSGVRIRRTHATKVLSITVLPGLNLRGRKPHEAERRAGCRAAAPGPSIPSPATQPCTAPSGPIIPASITGLCGRLRQILSHSPSSIYSKTLSTSLPSPPFSGWWRPSLQWNRLTSQEGSPNNIMHPTRCRDLGLSRRLLQAGDGALADQRWRSSIARRCCEQLLLMIVVMGEHSMGAQASHR
jgi:hypothetical protein